MKRIVLVGGGSGGHFYPLIATAERLNEYKAQGMDLELYYMGPEPYNKADLDANRITFISIPTGKRRKYFSVLNFIDLFKVFFGLFFAVAKLYKLYPDVVFSKGGYTSVPVVIAAWLLRIPIMVHESDTRAGSANKLGGKFARYVAIAFDDAAKDFPAEKTALTGIPMRKAFLEIIANPIQQLGLPSEKPLLFVTGGSIGAQKVNSLIIESLDDLLPNFTILHQTGEKNEERVRQTSSQLITDTTLLARYFVKGNLTAHEMNLAQSAASIIISRAGTGTIFEIAHKGKPSIVIPIPEDVSHDQRTNAYAYARSGAASVLEEANMTDGLLTSEITRIMGNQETYDAMSAAAVAFAGGDAAATIAKTLIGVTSEHI
ncbi:MAG: UDP-N-acetylglucosamine--N-acetylmuramyl-(pentapeptide) pyrophosphoryl-undecaprenol N-acetylglucosamine transferase [Patiriisocius sp.]|jgi:UDP-N-acetylglucosamine--N-acetylmuramyl-(pentapeptide) pyrophosphoryl-undecaprenol N-acetylglucosamine transferase